MSPSSLTPLEEDKSLDLNAFMDEIGSGSLDERERFSSNLSCGELNLDGSPTGVSRGKGGSQSVSGLPITSSPITGSGSGGLAFNPGSGTKTIATARAGLRRKVTGMGSPLAQLLIMFIPIIFLMHQVLHSSAFFPILPYFFNFVFFFFINNCRWRCWFHMLFFIMWFTASDQQVFIEHIMNHPSFWKIKLKCS